MKLVVPRTLKSCQVDPPVSIERSYIKGIVYQKILMLEKKGKAIFPLILEETRLKKVLQLA